MPSMTGLEGTFDTVSSTYEKMRPGYPESLYQKMFDYISLSPLSHVAEIGIGGGQATLPFLKTGCKLTAIEYGAKLAALCQEKFKAYPQFSVITSKFEDAELPNESFDLIFSATAFHWIPADLGYQKVFRLLKKGGMFARFACHPYPEKEGSPLFEEIQELYKKYYYPYYRKEPETPSPYPEKQARALATLPLAYGFTDTSYHMFERTRRFTAEEYVQLLSTYSDHIAMEEGIRTKFHKEIENAIRRHGGTLTIYDTLDLQLAKKP